MLPQAFQHRRLPAARCGVHRDEGLCDSVRSLGERPVGEGEGAVERLRNRPLLEEVGRQPSQRLFLPPPLLLLLLLLLLRLSSASLSEPRIQRPHPPLARHPRGEARERQHRRGPAERGSAIDARIDQLCESGLAPLHFLHERLRGELLGRRRRRGGEPALRNCERLQVQVWAQRDGATNSQEVLCQRSQPLLLLLLLLPLRLAVAGLSHDRRWMPVCLRRHAKVLHEGRQAEDGRQERHDNSVGKAYLFSFFQERERRHRIFQCM